MGNTQRIGIGVLVGLFFAAGYATRIHCMARDQEIAARTGRGSGISTGTRIASLGLEGAGNLDFKPIETLYSVVKSLREHYVEQLTSKDEGKMTHDALKAMLSSLKDPNTRFLEPAQRKVVADAQEGKFHGIGAVLAVKRVKVTENWGSLQATDSKPAVSASAAAKTGAAKPAPQPGAKPPAQPAAKPLKPIQVEEEHLIVIATLPGSAAAEAGLKSGDDIREIDGKSVLPFDPFQRLEELVKRFRGGELERAQLQKQAEAEQKRIENGVSVYDAQSLLMSEDQKPLELAVLHKGASKTVKIKLQPREFTVEPVASSVVEDNTGYIRINYFGTNTGERFDSAIKEIRSKDVKGLVLDLRGVPGGDTQAAAEVARWFAPGKNLAVVEKSRNRKAPVRIPEEPAAWTGPVVVLVNGGTARTAEVLASSLKDNSGARLVGENTYGDFAETTLLEQADGSAVSMTTGVFLRGNGVSHQGKGLSVDKEVAAAQGGDRQLTEAVKLLGS